MSRESETIPEDKFLVGAIVIIVTACVVGIAHIAHQDPSILLPFVGVGIFVVLAFAIGHIILENPKVKE